MKLTWDEPMRNEILRTTGLDLATAEDLFAGVRFEHPGVDQTAASGTVTAVGFLAGRMVVVEWEARGEGRHVVAMRKANEREQKQFGDRLGSINRA